MKNCTNYEKYFYRLLLETVSSYDLNRLAYVLFQEYGMNKTHINLNKRFDIEQEIYRETGEAFFKGKLINDKRTHITPQLPTLTLDPDNSERSFIYTESIFYLLWKWEGVETNKSGGKIPFFEGLWQGDVYNSAQTTLNVYSNKSNSFEKLYSKSDFLEKYQNDKSSLLPKLYLFGDFLGETHHIGNIGLVPNTYNLVKNREFKDYFDLFLYKLSPKDNCECNYYKTASKDGEMLFKNKKDFNKYINMMFLWDYTVVNEGSYIVTSLFHKRDEKNPQDAHSKFFDGKKSSYLPDEKEIPIYLKNVQWIIRRRGIFIVAMLLITQVDLVIEDCKIYNDWTVSSIYKCIINELYYADATINNIEDALSKVLEIVANLRINNKNPIHNNKWDKIESILSAAHDAIRLTKEIRY